MDTDDLKVLLTIGFVIGGIIGGFLLLINYDFEVEGNLVSKMSCDELKSYIINNADSGLVARWQYDDRCAA